MAEAVQKKDPASLYAKAQKLFLAYETPPAEAYDLLIAAQVAEGAESAPFDEGPSDKAYRILCKWADKTGGHYEEAWTAAENRHFKPSPHVVREAKSAAKSKIPKGGKGFNPLSDDDLDEAIEAAGINTTTLEDFVVAFMRKFQEDDAGIRNRLTTKLGTNKNSKGATSFKPSEIEKFWKKIDAEVAQEQITNEAKARAKKKAPDYVPLDQATPVSVLAAAATSPWLPDNCAYRDGWFGEVIPGENGNVIFRPNMRAFEVVVSARGELGSSRTNQTTIRYLDPDDETKVMESTFRIGDTFKDKGTILGQLANEGVQFAPRFSSEYALVILRAIRSERVGVYHAQPGWTEDRKTHISPTGHATVSPGDKRVHVLEDTKSVKQKLPKGGRTEFSKAASAALKGRAAEHFLMGFMMAPVGCLADFLGVEQSVIVANEGKARHGKSTSLKAGVSWFTIPTAKGLFVSGNATETALEILAEKGSGAAFAPDEEGSSSKSAEDEQKMVLQYADSMGRNRGQGAEGLREVRTWTGAMGLSTEAGLLGRLEAAQSNDNTLSIRAGALSRIFTVNYDNAVSLTRADDAEELTAYDVLAHDAKKGGGVYGVAGPLFAAKLIEYGVDEVQGRVSGVEHEWVADYSGAAERIVKMAALFAVACEIAEEAGLLPCDVDLKGMVKVRMVETIAQRAHQMDTRVQAMDSLRLNIIRAVNNGTIRPVGTEPEGFRETLGYFAESKTPFDAPEAASFAARTYILPKDRLSLLGVKREHAALVKELREVDALVLPSQERYAKLGYWQNTPGEGNVPSIRVSGTWVHGDDKLENKDQST
jgi:hypothetical protein